MGQTIFYCLLFVTISFFFLKKKTPFISKLLLMLYSITAILAIVAVGCDLVDYSKVSLIGYIFLAVAIFIYFAPFLCNKKRLSSEKMIIRENKGYLIICLFYVLCSVITVIKFIPGIKSLIQSGDWSMNRNDLYHGDLSFPYDNFFEFVAMNLTDYFRLLVLVIAFSSLRNNKHHLVYYSAIIGGVASMLVSAIYTSSRGTIINAGLLIIALFLFFAKQYSPKTRRVFLIAAISSLAILIPYLIVVTVSRFGDLDDGGVDSIVAYLGQSPVVFNSGVFTIEKLLYGKNAFGVLFGYNYKESMIGGTWDSGFYTFVGWIFIDWGIIGTLLIGIVAAYWMKSIINKKRFFVSDIFLIFFYYNTLLSGVFVIGRSYCYNIIASALIYLFIRFVVEENERFVLKNVPSQQRLNTMKIK